VLQGHITLRFETNTGTENVGQGASLLSKSVDDRRSRRSQRSLEHVAENAKHAVEVLEILGSGTVVGGGLPLDASHHLSDKNKINNQWGSKKRVLADIEDTVLVSTFSFFESMTEAAYEIV